MSEEILQLECENRLQSEIAAVERFIERVNRQAERNMSRTGTIAGAHYNAMSSVLADMRRELEQLEREREGQ